MVILIDYSQAFLFHLLTLQLPRKAHRDKRKKEMHTSELEPIEGLGRVRKKLLLNHFGSIKNIKTASSQDIMKVKGISRLLSEKIYAYFND